jgi:two-component system response regulator AlgR
MRVLVVDDEPLARRRLAAQVGDSGLAEVVGEADNGVAALTAAETLQPDVVLLDVRMPEMDGLEAARHLRALARPPIVIITTAYDEHALAAFESEALDYLLKPIRSERLAAALERAAALRAGRDALADADAPAHRRHLSALVGGQLRRVAVTDVIYFQAEQRYVSAVTADTRLLIEDPLRALEVEFADLFVRVHRNALVQPAHVRALERDLRGNVVIAFAARPERLVVSRRLLSQVRRRLRET